jgi:aspartate kinase
VIPKLQVPPIGESYPSVQLLYTEFQSLLRAAREAGNRQSKAYEEIINAIQLDHIAEAKRRIKSSELCTALCEQVTTECQLLQRFLCAVDEIGEVSSRTLDKIISKGENLSCRFMTALLQDRGVDAQFVDLSDVIDFEGDVEDVDNLFYKNLSLALVKKIKACGDKVPVVTGYFGTVKGGLLNKIGRGYTDLCAALISVGLKADGQLMDELQIWKEVDGIFTANPAKVPTARLLPTISPAEAAELTFYGSEVIHPFTMEQVIKQSIPIRIRNVMNLRNTGTIISPEKCTSQRPSLSPRPSFFRKRAFSRPNTGDRPPRPTAITIKHKILVLNVHSNKRSLSHGFFANIFTVLDKWKLSVDLISTSEVHVSMALHSESAFVNGGEDDQDIVDTSLRGAIQDLAQYGTVDVLDGMAILSLVGKQMKNMTGIAGKMFSVLGENNVNIEMISQGK